MRIGIRSAISGLVLMSIIVSAVGVHLLWWRTASQVSQTLADTINDQIVSAVGDQLQSVTTEARSASIAVRALLTEKVLDIDDAKRRKFVFLSQLQAQPTISWVAFGWPDGSFFAAHKLGDTGVEMLEIGTDRKLKVDRYDYAGGDLKLRDSRVEETKYLVTEQEWYRGSDLWSTLTAHPTGERPAAAFAVSIDVDGKPAGVLAIIIELTRVSNFLSQLTVGKSAGAFILGPVQATIQKLLIGLAVLILFAGLLSAWLAQRLIAAPLIRVVNEIRHVERFDLDKVQRHPSRLTEIENLSGAIGDMAQGLAAFRKYIPADLVRRLVSDGTGARLGGAVRPMSVMFIDLAGFTGMSERLGDRILP